MPPSKPGPKTEQGKKRSSLNALKHALTAISPHALAAIAAQSEADLSDILARMTAHYRPKDALEEELVNRIARCVWRLARSADIEQRLLNTSGAIGRPRTSQERILRYERLVDIHLHRAIAALDRKKSNENKSK